VSGGGDDQEELRRLRRRVAVLEAEGEIARRLAAFDDGPAGRERIARAEEVSATCHLPILLAFPG